MKGHRIEFVYQNIGERRRMEIIDLWLNAGALVRQTAEQRVSQVSTMIFDRQDSLVGVSTVYLSDFYIPDNPYFFFRIFIKPSARGSYRLFEEVTKVTFSNLKKNYATQAHGMVIELENRKLEALGANTPYLQKRGYTYHGKSARGFQLWYVRFDEPKGIYAGL